MPFKSKEQMYSYWLASSRALTPLQYARLLELAGSSAALFEDPDIIRHADSLNPQHDIETINL